MEDLIGLKHRDSIAGGIKCKEVGGRIKPVRAGALPRPHQRRNRVDSVLGAGTGEDAPGRERSQGGEGDRAIVN